MPQAKIDRAEDAVDEARLRVLLETERELRVTNCCSAVFTLTRCDLLLQKLVAQVQQSDGKEHKDLQAAEVAALEAELRATTSEAGELRAKHGWSEDHIQVRGFWSMRSSPSLPTAHKPASARSV